MMRQPSIKISVIMHFTILTQLTSVIDGQTDGQTVAQRHVAKYQPLSLIHVPVENMTT